MKIALGTVQFGMHYGIANWEGQVPQKVAKELLNIAWAAGVDTLDTAMLYGDSEEVLGQIGITDWRVVTKLPPIPADCPCLSGWIERSIEESLHRLKIKRLYGLLLHRSDQLAGNQGEQIYWTLQDLKTSGLVYKIGVSIYSPEELDSLFHRFSLDMVQAPLNIIDRRIVTSGWLTRLHNEGVEVHARSIFLQGLLLMDTEARPAPFKRWQSLWMIWHQWLQDNQLTPLTACLGFVLSRDEVDRVIVGVDNKKHLKEIILAAGNLLPLDPPTSLCSEDLDLINPSRWS